MLSSLGSSRFHTNVLRLFHIIKGEFELVAIFFPLPLQVVLSVLAVLPDIPHLLVKQVPVMRMMLHPCSPTLAALARVTSEDVQPVILLVDSSHVRRVPPYETRKRLGPITFERLTRKHLRPTAQRPNGQVMGWDVRNVQIVRVKQVRDAARLGVVKGEVGVASDAVKWRGAGGVRAAAAAVAGARRRLGLGGFTAHVPLGLGVTGVGVSVCNGCWCCLDGRCGRVFFGRLITGRLVFLSFS